jgi:hypothetical protein
LNNQVKSYTGRYGKYIQEEAVEEKDMVKGLNWWNLKAVRRKKTAFRCKRCSTDSCLHERRSYRKTCFLVQESGRSGYHIQSAQKQLLKMTAEIGIAC